jgi:hypothetical protein
MGHAHVEHLDGTFGGLVCTNSLKCKGSMYVEDLVDDAVPGKLRSRRQLTDRIQ